MTNKEIINDLKMQIQALEDLKTSIDEQQEDIRTTIHMIEVESKNDNARS